MAESDFSAAYISGFGVDTLTLATLHNCSVKRSPPGPGKVRTKRSWDRPAGSGIISALEWGAPRRYLRTCTLWQCQVCTCARTGVPPRAVLKMGTQALRRRLLTFPAPTFLSRPRIRRPSQSPTDRRCLGGHPAEHAAARPRTGSESGLRIPHQMQNATEEDPRLRFCKLSLCLGQSPPPPHSQPMRWQLTEPKTTTVAASIK